MSEKYWLPGDEEELRVARTYSELFPVAERILSRMPRPRGQMCGPISTGGAGTIEANLKRFEVAYEHIIARGIEVFNQLPFERHMNRIWRETENGTGYSTKLLDDFYLPIFENKLVDTLYFLPEWQTSRGAQWEHEQALRVGLSVEYLPDDLFT